MNKLEERLKNVEGSRLQYVCGGYLYYNKESINKLKYPSLFRIRKEYEADLKAKDKMSSYYKVNHSILIMSYAREYEKELKNELRINILNIMKQNNVSMSLISRIANIKKPNLSNFLSKELNSALSLDNVKNIYKILRNEYE